MAKNKKRQHSRTVELKRQQEQEKIAQEKSRSKNRWNPAGRALLWGDLIFLALTSLLELNGLLPPLAAGVCTVIGFLLLLAALWLLFGPKSGRGGLGGGPRL